jgi:RNA-directed DNA polymerase
LKLLLDENLSRRIVPALSARFPGSSQVGLLGLERSTDEQLCDFAAENDYVLVSKDDDFPARHLGTPQGGPLSPLLANVLLDEVDKALEVRGYSFARYADDCNVYVGSKKAGERVMAYLRKLYAKLQLQINEAKSAVASAFGRKFLGYALWGAKGKEVKCTVAKKALDNFKARIRQLTGRSGGRSTAQVVEKLRPYLLGWKAYFELAQTPRVWRELDEWLRHRLRAIQLKQWKRGSTIYRELMALGATQSAAERVADNSRCWWRNSRGALNTVLTIAYFDRLGVPRLSRLPSNLN